MTDSTTSEKSTKEELGRSPIHRPVRVAVVKAAPARHEARVHRTALAFVEQAGYEVEVVSLRPRTQGELDRPNSYSVHEVSIVSRRLPFGWLPVRAAEGLLRILSRLLRVQPDLISCHNLEALFPGVAAARLLRVPVIYNAGELEGGRNIHGSEIRRRMESGLRRRLEGFFARRCDAVAAADIERARVMERWYGLRDVAAIRNLPLHWKGRREGKLRRSLGLGEDVPLVLYQGLATRGRGLEVGLAALGKLSCSNVHLVILGFGSEAYIDELQAVAHERRMHTRFHVHPPVPWPEVPSWTADADVSLVLIQNEGASYYYGAPNKFYESIMAGVPYLASDFPEMRRVHEKVRGGALVDPSDPDAVAAALQELLADSSAREKMGQRERRFARQALNWESERRKLLRLAEDVLN